VDVHRRLWCERTSDAMDSLRMVFLDNHILLLSVIKFIVKKVLVLLKELNKDNYKIKFLQ
jgi:hypothetical protein